MVHASGDLFVTDCSFVRRRWFDIIRSEYLEMPCLSLTLGQARRLWALETDLAQELLDELVAARFLVRTPRGRYLRANASV
jgi:hypothetical protein